MVHSAIEYFFTYTLDVNENLTSDKLKDADILESIVTETDNLLNSVKAEEVDLHYTLEIDPTDIKLNMNLENLITNPIFLTALKRKKLEMSELETSLDTETFLKKTMDIKFCTLFDKGKTNIDQPDYILFQSKEKGDYKWSIIKLYKVNDNMTKFYDNLTTKTIEIQNGDKKFIYRTSNSGNNWSLENVDVEDDVFKKLLDNEEIKIILQDKNLKVVVV